MAFVGDVYYQMAVGELVVFTGDIVAVGDKVAFICDVVGFCDTVAFCDIVVVSVFLLFVEA